MSQMGYLRHIKNNHRFFFPVSVCSMGSLGSRTGSSPLKGCEGNAVT